VQPSVLRIFLFLCVLVLQKPGSLIACGPDFPNSLLDGGDAAVLVAPVSDFIGELRRMKLVESRFQAVPLTGGNAGEDSKGRERKRHKVDFPPWRWSPASSVKQSLPAGWPPAGP